jgi:hypothetical protein
MQNPFPAENQSKSMAKKGFLFSRLDKKLRLQVLRSRSDTSRRTLVGALFQTMAVTGKKRFKPQTTWHKSKVEQWNVGKA